MSRWTHPTCSACYAERYPDRQPARLTEAYREAERCCYCGRATIEGIYTRHDPTGLRCGGDHGEER